MEFGKPPLYQVLYLAERMQDMAYVDSLGPFSYALRTVTQLSDINKKNDDRILNGAMKGMDGPIGYFDGMFVTFRGCFMDPLLLLNYEQSIDYRI